MAAGSSLDLICNQVPRLEGIGHSARAHTDTVANANGAKLIPNHAGIDNGLFYTLTETEQMAVTPGVIGRASRGAETSFCGEEGRTGFLRTCLVVTR